MDSWLWWVLTCAFSLYFVILLLEFNKPAKKLMEQIDAQEKRRIDMEQRLSKMREDAAGLRGKLEALESEWDELEDRRKDLLPQANVRRMIEIKAGPFPMGSRAEDSPNNERPVHVVYLPTFYISPYPVTNLEYREFVNCTGYKAPMHWQRGSYPTGTGRHPVTNVSWHDAKAYAEWLGARLPTEAEWEKAARGTDERLYPWGSRFMDERCNCNNMMGGPLPVDEFPMGRSPYGLWDMSGNVYEWCEDYYDENYYKNSPNNNPKGPEGGQERVVRGGSYQENRPAVRTTHRDGTGEHITREIQGFRLAMSEPRDNPRTDAPPRKTPRAEEPRAVESDEEES
ncbi:MAG: SUMF1/EgtB/PvdO family nonheme iron enzyme [Candidatus Latescibacteria bacterium]|nr:SUMF1/EgtB/PvdO family nonheme iron enzyme [Candidatus Latescibacterota bacterium]